MGAATAARATTPYGVVTQEPYRNRQEKRKAERAALLAAAVASASRANHIVQSAQSGAITDTERLVWEQRTIRAQRAKDAQGKPSEAPAPRRTSNPPPPHSRLFAPAMSCDAARDTRLSKGARLALQLIHAVQKGRTPIIHRAWLADRLGVCARQAQRYIAELRRFDLVTVSEVRTAKGWMIAQIIRITAAVLPFFQRSRPKKGGNPGETNSSPLQIPLVSESTIILQRSEFLPAPPLILSGAFS